jgi:arylsulfatase A-like enzyme
MLHRVLPNVLFVTADQWRGDSLSCAGHPVVRTPNLDRLARSGVRFARHFAQAAPCGPSRASLYTGMYLMNHRSATNGTPLDSRHTNVALEVRKLGYRPALFGYTDTSIDPRTVPPGDERLRHYEGVLPGFDPVCHLPEGDPAAWLAALIGEGYEIGREWRRFVDDPVADYPGVDEWGPHRAPTQYRAAHSQTAFLTDRLLEYIERAGVDPDGRPWFAHLSYLRPHPPFHAPEPYNTMFDPMTVPMPRRAASREVEGAQHPLLAALISHPFLASPDDEKHLRQLRATYYGMQAEVDDQLGRVLDYLDTSGEAGRTVVVMTSDHGEMLGDHFLLHKLGWFDSSFHVPLIVRDPRAECDARRGEVVDAFTEHVDVLPTLLDLLGAEVPLQCDGRPLTGFLRDDGEQVGEAAWRAETHFEFDFRDAGSDLLEQAFDLTMEECSIAVLRDDHGKYVHFAGLPAIFFDLDTDPDQIVNRADDPAYAAAVLTYAQRMLSWRMRHEERTLAGMKLTEHAGLVERRAARR